MRAGAWALSLLAMPLNVHVLKALEEETRSLIDLRRAVGSPPQTTLRSNLRTLDELGLVERLRQRDFPMSVAYELTLSGREILAVADVVRTWLALAPEGPLQLGSVAAKSAIKALAGGWSSAIVRALAARPLALTELDRLIFGFNYPSLERRLGAMRLAGLVDPRPSSSRGTPYVVSDWLRWAVVPLAAATRWEQQHIPSTARPIGKIDAESIFFLAVPLLDLDAEVSGSCRLAIEVSDADAEAGRAGVRIDVEEGRVVSCVSRVQDRADAWALGAAESWIQALLEHDPDSIEVGGGEELARALLDALFRALAASPQRA